MKIGIIYLNLAHESADTRIVFTLARTLKKMGHWVVIYAAEFDPTVYPALQRGLDIRVARLNTPLAWTISTHGFWGKIRERIRRYLLYVGMVKRITHALEPDFHLVICHDDYSYQIANRYKKINPEAKIVWTMNNVPFYPYLVPRTRFPVLWVHRLNARWERFQMGWYLNSIDRIVVLDEKRRQLTQKVGVHADILPVPVDFKHFYAPTRTLAPMKSPVKILAVGLLTPTRRFEDAILAVQELAAVGYPVEFTLVSQDTWRNAAYREFLEQLVAQHALREKVTLYFDRVKDSDLKKIYQSSHIFLLLNTAQFWSMAAFEAMAAGNLLVVSDVTTVADVLRNGENALMVETERPDQIADHIRFLIEHPKAHRRIARGGQKFVRENLDWGKYAQALLEMAFERSPEQ